MNPIVYLAGPIAGADSFDVAQWRREAELRLFDRCVDTLNPLRRKDVLAARPRIATDFHEYAHLGTFFTAKAIMARDFSDVCRADALLVNLIGAERVSIGTVMELAWAFQMKKPAVVAIEPAGNIHDRHPMIHEAIPFRVASLEEAIDAVAVILGR